MFAPDGESIAYIETGDNVLKRIPIGGGTSVTMASVVGLPCGATWSREGILMD